MFTHAPWPKELLHAFLLFHLILPLLETVRQAAVGYPGSPRSQFGSVVHIDDQPVDSPNLDSLHIHGGPVLGTRGYRLPAHPGPAPLDLVAERDRLSKASLSIPVS